MIITKKALAILMALISILSVYSVCFADNHEFENNTFETITELFSEVYQESYIVCEEESETNPLTVPETETSEEEETDPEETQPLEEMAAVARVYLCATANSLTGHLWLYFINLTDYELPLGYVTLMPHEEMSVGSLRNTRADGGGTYYNGEAYMAKSLESLSKHTTSLSMEVNLEQLNKMSEKIRKRNTYILLGNNCGNFACAVWNTVANVKIINILVPAPTIWEMKIFGGKTNQIQMLRPSIERVFKQVSGTVRQAQEKSFRQSCVNW